MAPVRVVAPTRVNGGRSSRIDRAAGPLPMTMSSWKSSMRRVEDLLDGPGQAVDLVDEEHVAVLELGEDGGQVAGALDGRTRRGHVAHAHLVGDDGGEGGLAQPGRAGEQQVVDGLAPSPGGFEDDAEVLLEPRLADEVVERAGTQARVDDGVVVDGARCEQLFPHRPVPVIGRPPVDAGRP